MIDQILGRPSPILRRSQIFFVLFFWLWRLYKGDGAAPLPSRASSAAGAIPSRRFGPGNSKRGGWIWRLWVMLIGKRVTGWFHRVNERLKHFSPSQLILGTFTLVYALRHVGDIFGLGVPEPLASLYSRSYYRATYVNTAFDAGFASAMAIRPKWLKDICSVLFALYYLVWASEGDEVLRRFRALCTVEMLRVTWEKTNNPYIRLLTAWHRPSLSVHKDVLIPRPSTSSRFSLPPVRAVLYFSGTQAELAEATQIVIDFPGGGFVAMGPECHEERLRRWAKRTRKPVLGVRYGKAPEYPYPWAIEEGFDAYRTLMETKGSCIGINSEKLDIVLTGDSAGGNICATIMLRILEHPTSIPRPTSIILAYPALDFNFTSWMSPANLRVLRSEQSETHMPGVMHGKDHMRHKSPLSVVDDVETPSGRRQRQQSWGQAIGKIPALALSPLADKSVNPLSPVNGWTKSLPRTMSTKLAGWLASSTEDQGESSNAEDNVSEPSDSEEDDDKTVRGTDRRREEDKSLRERVKTPKGEKRLELPPVAVGPLSVSPKASTDLNTVPGVETTLAGQPKKKKVKAPVGTRLTMTSRVGYFQDRIITPSMMRAMAILYIGPRRNPDFETDYYISPILSPPHLLAHFPPVYLICGERDPFVDDTIIFAGKIREAKRTRRAQAQVTSQSKSARFGEGLRMSTNATQTDTPDHIIRENDDDWVQMRIIEGWGHGFMQMTALIREVDSVLLEMADWIDESFAKGGMATADVNSVAEARAAVTRSLGPDQPVLSPEEHIPPPASIHVKTAKDYKVPSIGRSGGIEGDLGSPLHSDDDDTTITFTPKNKRRPPPSKFHPVVRRPSKESLDLHRSFSAPKFDLDETGSSGEVVTLRTPPLGTRALPPADPKGSGAFAFFNHRSSSLAPKPIQPSSGPLTPSGSANGSNRPTNSLVAAAVAGARAASPALAAAGLVPQSLGNMTQAELMRKRRLEAVFGIGGIDDDGGSDEGEDGEEMG